MFEAGGYLRKPDISQGAGRMLGGRVHGCEYQGFTKVERVKADESARMKKPAGSLAWGVLVMVRH